MSEVDGMGTIERRPRLYAIEFSNGWRYSEGDESANEARERGLPVVEYVPASQLVGAVEERDALEHENASLRARLQDRDDECNRWAMRWATDDRTAGGQ